MVLGYSSFVKDPRILSILNPKFSGQLACMRFATDVLRAHSQALVPTIVADIFRGFRPSYSLELLHRTAPASILHELLRQGFIASSYRKHRKLAWRRHGHFNKDWCHRVTSVTHASTKDSISSIRLACWHNALMGDEHNCR